MKKPTPAMLWIVMGSILAAGCADKPTEQLSTQELKSKTARVEEKRLTSPALVDQAYKQEAYRTAGDALALHEQALTASPAMLGRTAMIGMPGEALDRENYAPYKENALFAVAEQPVSTFSIDVDTGSYSNLRRMLREGRLPVQNAVRVEEMINYFSYDYALPKHKREPFKLTTEIAATPWNPDTQLLHIGIQGYEVPAADIPAANLVFLLDVSGSMASEDKLGLLQKAMKLLVNKLRAEDKVSIVVYAGASGVVLKPTDGNKKFDIVRALDELSAGGSTNGAAGIELAYELAESVFIQGGINRILLATDGDFNVGTVDFDSLIDLVEEKRKSGIGLSTLGFGSGNYNDHLMEQLADAGNGSYAYIDTLQEAGKVLSDQLSSTLMTIAQDVKIQVEFNPQVVSEYRLVGYENRILAREDFNNDKVDAGDIGAGHSVTALYEIALVGSAGNKLDPLRYTQSAKKQGGTHADELALIRLRFKQPGAAESVLLETPVSANSRDIGKTSETFRFSAAVAGFGQLLRGGKHVAAFDYDAVLALARAAKGADAFGYRGEFLQLVSLARDLDQSAAHQVSSAGD